jgi:transcriptional regulator of met regulon
MPQKAHLIERENIQISTDKRTREQIAALALAGETTASAVVRAAVNEAYAKKFGRKETVATFTYEQAIRYLCGDPVFQSNDDRRDEARDAITEAVWLLVKEDGNGKGELRDWIAMGDWSPYDLHRLDALAPSALAAEWDEYQRQAQQEATN